MKVVLGQFSPVLGDKKKNLSTINAILEQASRNTSDLVLFPELTLTGYFIQDIDHNLAEPIDGPSIQHMRRLCKKHQLYTVFPWAELVDDGTVYNSACLISNEGEVIGNYRKVHLYDTEKEVFTPGKEFKVFDTPLGKIGLMICFDLDFPESARCLALQGADIILIPTNNMEPYQRYQETYLKSRSMENEVPLAICNRTGKERELVYFGESAAYDGHGNQLTKADNTKSFKTVEVPLHQEPDPNLHYRKNRAPNAYQQLREK